MIKEPSVMGMNMLITKMKELTKSSHKLNDELDILYTRLYTERNPRKLHAYDIAIRQRLQKMLRYQTAIKAQIEGYVKMLDVNRRGGKR